MLKFDIETITPTEMKQGLSAQQTKFKSMRSRLATSTNAKPDMTELYNRICLKALASKPMKDRTLNSITAPGYYEEESRCFRKTVSYIPASREEVQQLQDELDQTMMSHRGRLQGLCPIRRDIFQQCFDEVIRQMTLDCPERGLLLLRIRSEQNMTISAMETLFSDGLVREMGLQWDIELAELDEIPSFKERQNLSFQKIQKRQNAQEKLQNLRESRKDALERKQNVFYRLELLKQKNLDNADALKKKHSEDYHFVKRSNAAYKIHIDETQKAIASFADLDPVAPAISPESTPTQDYGNDANPPST